MQILSAGFKVSLRWGNLATLRLLLGVMAHPWLHFGLRVQRIQPPGCEPAYWLSLKSAQHRNQDGSPRQPDILLCYVHGGAFVAGDPLMCAATFQRWMNSLARQGLYTKVLCISYPLAPEWPFPAAVASTAAAFAWVGRQFPAGCGTSIIAVGDSAGGNIAAASLAALRDYLQQQQQPVLAALGQQEEEPPATSILQSIASNIADSNNSSSTTPPAAGSTAAVSEAATAAAPAGAAQHSTSQASGGSLSTVDTNSTTAVTAAIEAKLFADLHRRLAAAGITTGANSTMNSSSPASTGVNNTLPAAPTVGQVAAVRMPTAIILVSPATDISPTASFRKAARTPQVDALEVASAASGPDSGTDSTPHYDYLPQNLESGGMGSYAEQHEALCGVYASPVHLHSFEGLCEGRWLVLAGGVELLAPDIARWVGASDAAMAVRRQLKGIA